MLYSSNQVGLVLSHSNDDHVILEAPFEAIKASFW